MVAVKQEAQDIIKNLPDNCTYEDIQYHLYAESFSESFRGQGLTID